MSGKTLVRLSKKVNFVLKFIYDSSFKKRARRLEKTGEYSFLILLYWNQIEMLIKILKYQIIFGNGKKTKDSLWSVRDKIVHANRILTEGEYEVFKDASKWVFEQLFTNMPETHDLARKQYLEHKRKYDKRAG